MIWSSNNKWGSKLRQKQAPQNRSTPRLLPPTWASAAESPGPKDQGQKSPQGSPSLPLGLPKGPEHGATARQWPCEPSAPQRVNLQGNGGGGSRRGLPAPPPGAARGSLPWPPSCLRCTLPRRARSVGVAGPPRGGEDEGRPVDHPLGAPPDQDPPSDLPEWAMVMGGVMGGAASILFCCAAVRRPQAWSARCPARWCGLARRPGPPREQAAGGAGARGVQVQPHPSPPRRGPL